MNFSSNDESVPGDIPIFPEFGWMADLEVCPGDREGALFLPRVFATAASVAPLMSPTAWADKRGAGRARESQVQRIFKFYFNLRNTIAREPRELSIARTSPLKSFCEDRLSFHTGGNGKCFSSFDDWPPCRGKGRDWQISRWQCPRLGREGDEEIEKVWALKMWDQQT